MDSSTAFHVMAILSFLISGGTMLLGFVWLTFAKLYKNKDTSPIGEMVFIGLSAALLAGSTLVTLLTILHIYSIWLTCILFAVIGLSLIVFIKKSMPHYPLNKVFSSVKQWSFNKILFFLLIAALLMYGLFPTQYFFGGRDYGIYMIHAIHISETGSVQYESDEFLQENYTDMDGFVSLDYPAIFSTYYQGLDDDPGGKDPQFLPAFPASLAVGYDLAGMDGLLRVNVVFSLFSMLAMYYLAKRMMGQKVALLATLFLAISPAQIWGTRITQSEQLAQFQFLLLCFYFAYALQEQYKPFILWAGLLTGIMQFARIDNFIVPIGFCALGCYYCFFHPKWSKTFASSSLLMASLSVISIWYGFTYHHWYYVNHFLLMKYLFLFSFVFFVLLWISIVVSHFVHQKKKTLQNPVYLLCKSKLFLLVLLLLLASAIFFAYFIRPRYISGFYGDALHQFGWYICVLTYPLAAIGLCVYLYSSSSQKFEHNIEPLLFLLGLGIGSIVMYLHTPYVASDHFWASRRFVPVNYPVLQLLAAYALVKVPSLFTHKFLKTATKVTSASLAVFITLFMVYQCRADYFTPLLKDVDKQYEALVEHIPDNALVFTNDAQLASPLKMIYHRDVYILGNEIHGDELYEMDIEQFLAFVQNSARPVYILGNSLLSNLFFDLDLVYESSIGGEYIERTIGTYPTKRELWLQNANLYKVEPLSSTNNRKTAVSDKLFLAEGTSLDGQIYTSSSPHSATFYGPYMLLLPGTYTVTFDVTEIASPLDGALSIHTDYGETSLSSIQINGSGQYSATFTLNEQTTTLETVLTLTSPAQFQINELSIQIT